jgi:2-phospho-L-lactate guanylyltransferase
MNAALLPIRALASAKGRLGAALSGDARERLTLAMLADMVDALDASRAVARTFVVSADAAVLEAAANLGAEPLPESSCQAGGLNGAVRDAAGQLVAAGVTRLLMIPGDVPLIEPREIDALFALDADRHPVIAVASRSGTGTNGLLLSPPDVITPRFEGASLEAHRMACRERGLTLKEAPQPSFALDVDTPEDITLLAMHGAHRRAGRVVAALKHVAA